MTFEEIKKMADSNLKFNSFVAHNYDELSKCLDGFVNEVKSKKFQATNDDEIKSIDQIYDEMVKIKAEYFDIIETCKSFSRQQKVHVDNIMTQIKILASIQKKTNGDFQQDDVKSVDYATGRILSSFEKFNEIKADLKKTLVLKEKIIENRNQIWKNKVQLNEQAKKWMIDFCSKHQFKFTLGALGLGAMVGGLGGLGILLSEILGGAGLVIIGSSAVPPALVITIPAAVGSVILATTVCLTIEYYKCQKNKYLAINKQKDHKFDEIENDGLKVENSMIKFNKTTQDLMETENKLGNNIDDIKAILTNKDQRKVLSNNDTFKDTIRECNQLKKSLKAIERFKYDKLTANEFDGDEIKCTVHKLVKMKTEYFNIVETLKSTSRKQLIDVEYTSAQMEIFETSKKDRNDNSKQQAVKRIDLAWDRLLLNFDIFHEIELQIEELNELISDTTEIKKKITNDKFGESFFLQNKFELQKKLNTETRSQLENECSRLEKSMTEFIKVITIKSFEIDEFELDQILKDDKIAKIKTDFDQLKKNLKEIQTFKYNE